MSILRGRLKQMDEIFYHGRSPRVNLLLELGKDMAAQSATELGRPKECFTNSFYYVIGHNATYIEGEVFVVALGLTHAWVEEDGKVIDPTLAEADQREYLGVKIPTELVYRIMTGKYWSSGDGVLGCIQFYSEKTRNKMIREIRKFNQQKNA
jgi:hypothetical protein